MQKIRRIFSLLAMAAAIPLLANSSASASIPPPKAGEIETLGTSEGNENESSGLTAEVNQIGRNDAGNLTSIIWSIENSNNSYATLTWLYDRSYTYSGSYFSGVTASDSNSLTRYHPIMDGAGECLCAGKISTDFFHEVPPSGKSTYWSLFSVPVDVESLTVEIPGFDPIEDIPIS